jgi:hypothetical protein
MSFEFFVDRGWRSLGVPGTTTPCSRVGDAVDIEPSGAAAWLSEHSAEYGLCQIYGNEPWHYAGFKDAAVTGKRPQRTVVNATPHTWSKYE